ncbi:hypothetical protein [Propionispora vibrioides]|uniref:Uncharacterized protein n=1 Tax=Propionispora vibrioides TaxID=112903 RepID=A0A1H8ULT9_9FIRM|nr:hypothetical protein [Propionispora vibrioides]SEP04179.1 hypothetical protein SAMN04490178_10936 [Propionispora vibrioides]
MENFLGTIVQIITVLGFMAVLVKLLIVNPLQTAITALNDAVKELKTVLTRIEEEQKNIGNRLARTEESLKSVHKRVDKLEGKVHE